MISNSFLSKRFAFFLTVVASSLAPFACGQGFFSNSYTIQGRTIDLGEAGRTHQWGILSLDGDVSISDTTVGSIDEVGYIGVAGTGNFNLSGAKVQGDVWLRSGGTYNVSGGGSVTGHKSQGPSYDSVLNTAVQHANALSTNASSLRATNSYTTINTTNHNFTIAGTGNVVMKLTDFMMTGGTLTLQGNSTTTWIFDVSRYFSLSSGAKVIPSGGLLASNILFNVEAGSTSNVVLSGGSQLNGILLAATGSVGTSRTVALSGASIVNGEVVGRSVLLSGGSKVKHPPKASQ